MHYLLNFVIELVGFQSVFCSNDSISKLYFRAPNVFTLLGDPVYSFLHIYLHLQCFSRGSGSGVQWLEKFINCHRVSMYGVKLYEKFEADLEP